VEVNNNSEINKLFEEDIEKEVEKEKHELEALVESGAAGTADGSETGDSGGDYDESLEEGSSESFGFASKKALKKAKVAASPKLIAFRMMMGVFPFVLIIGFALGIAGCYWFFFGFNVGGGAVAADKAAEAVVAHLDDNLGFKADVLFISIYVKPKVDTYECILFCVTENDEADYSERAFRTVVNKDGETTVYAEFDQAAYDRLMAGTAEDRVRAGVMLEYRDAFNRCVSEIESEKSGWIGSDHNFIDFINIKTYKSRNKNV